MTLLRVPYFRQQTYFTCGPTVVRMILRYFKKHASEKTLARNMGTSQSKGTKHKAMIQELQKAGFYLYVNQNARFEELTLLLAWRHPVVVHYREPIDNEEHYAIIVGIKNGNIIMQDPWNGKHFSISRRVFAARWQAREPGMESYRWFMAVSRKPFPMGRQYMPIK